MSVGLAAVDEPMKKARSQLFPLANSSENGGCVPADIGYWKWTSYCPDCRQAEKHWLASRYQHTH